MDNTNIFKVNHLEENKIKKIYVFNGRIPILNESPWSLINKKGVSIFSPSEIINIFYNI